MQLLERAVAVRFFKSSHVGTPANVVSALKGDADVKVDTFCRDRGLVSDKKAVAAR
jgi:hypothetical protein